MESTRKHVGLWKACLLALMLAAAYECKAVPQLPESELVWKNIQVSGRKMTVFCIYTDSRGLAWIGTNSGLYFYDGVEARPVSKDEMFGEQIYSIVEKDGCLYLGSNNGLLTYPFGTGGTGTPRDGTPKEIRTLLLSEQTLWIGSLYGIYALDLASGELSNRSDGLPHKSVYSILRDSRGIIYAGTYGGLARWDSGTGRFQKVSATVEGTEQRDVFVNCLLESDDNRSIYIGGQGNLYRYTPTHDRWEKVPAVEGNNIKSLARTSTSHLLIGTENGVFDLHEDTLRHYRHDSRLEQTLADNEIWCIYADQRNNIWTGHEKGISIASNSTSARTVKLSTLARSGEGNEIHSIYRDSRNNLWFGGTNGIIRLADGARPEWYRHSDDAHALSHNRIRAIREDTDGNVWLSTDGGINRYNREADNFDVFHIVDQHGGHNANWVYATEEDGDYLWVGSYLGGLHYVAKAKFGKGGGEITADCSINDENKLFDGMTVDLRNDLVSDVVKDAAGNVWILLFRDNSLTRLSPGKGCTRYDIFELTGSYPTHIATDAQGRLWCAYKGGALMFQADGSRQAVQFPHTDGDQGVLAMGRVDDDLWISTQSNVWKIDGRTLEASLLPIPQKSYTALYHDKATGKVYLGGTDEIREVDPKRLGNLPDSNPIRMVLKDAGGGHFDLADLQAGRQKLTIPYGGSLTLAASTLDYSPESVQRYAYKLAKQPADTRDGWIVMPEGANTITLSDLSMGTYTLLLKTVGSPAAPLAIPLEARGPWTLSAGAIAVYVLALLALAAAVAAYLRRRSRKARQEEERRKALADAEKKLTFLSDISHDLKTPLSMILGPVSLLKEHARDDESRRTLETVYNNAVRLNNLIHRTLELKHLEDGDEGMLILSTFDVVEFVRGVFDTFRENNPQKQFVFHTACPQLLIEADAVKTESIITNLLSNACKYSDDGATISCGIDRNGGCAEIVVADDGVGIAPADQPLVFQRMFRAASTARLHEGTGIGLYLIKKYLELMGGNVDLYSRPGQGTAFTVTLPLSGELLSRQDAADAGSPGTGKPRVLIVEDNREISAFIQDLLRKDYTCLTAENGRTGLSLASSFAPHLLIVDEMMPVMRGSEMVRRLKQNPRLARIPIIMLTAKDDNQTETRSVELGIDAFMPKPFEPAVLTGRIGLLLQSRQAVQQQARIQSIAQARPIEAESADEKQLARIAKAIEDNLADPDLNVNFLCQKTGIPHKQLYRLIKKHLGLGPLDYIRRVRLQKAAMLLGQHRFTVSEVSYMVGFQTPSYFARCFQAQFGVKPSQYTDEGEKAGARTSCP